MISDQFENPLFIAEALTYPRAIGICKGESTLVMRFLTSSKPILYITQDTEASRYAFDTCSHCERRYRGFPVRGSTIGLEGFDVMTDIVSLDSTITSCTERRHLCRFITPTGKIIMLVQQDVSKTPTTAREGQRRHPTWGQVSMLAADLAPGRQLLFRHYPKRLRRNLSRVPGFNLSMRSVFGKGRTSDLFAEAPC
jgi:hypothetical protein